MENRRVRRRSFLETMAALPASALAQQQTANPTSIGVKVVAGEDRFGRALRLPEGRPLLIKVATQDTGGAFFLTEQPSGQKGGPPKHFHLEEDEWFYCLTGDYIVEVGTQRYELKPGNSVLGPRRVPHAFAFVGSTPGRLLIGFTPAGRSARAPGRYPLGDLPACPTWTTRPPGQPPVAALGALMYNPGSARNRISASELRESRRGQLHR